MFKQWKKLVAGALCLVMLICCIPATPANATTLEDTVSDVVEFGEYDTLDLQCYNATVLKIVMKDKGWFRLNFTPGKIGTSYELYNEENSLLLEGSYGYYTRIGFTVEEGVYYLRLWTEYGGNVGSYNYFAECGASEDVNMEICITVKKGKSIQLGTIFSNCKDKDVKWSSSKKKVATVSDKGKVKGLKKGTTTIKAWNSSGLVAKIKVKVV